MNPLHHADRPASAIIAPPDDDEEDRRAQVTNRLLLYMRGLGVRAQPSLEVAMEAMRRAGPGADMALGLREMHALLKEYGVEPRVVDREGKLLRSDLPLNRRPMLASDVRRDSLYRWMRKRLRGGAKPGSTLSENALGPHALPKQ